MYFSVDVFEKDPDTYMARCPELDVCSYGGSLEEAVERLKQIVNFYIESADEMGMTLEELGLAPPEEEAPPRVSTINNDSSIH